jgi:DNA-binding NtrC family response regulator
MPNNPHIAAVLVVDDEPLIRWALGEALTAKGYQVSEASDAAQVRALLTSPNGEPDAVLLDFRLPDSSDLRLLADLRRALPTVPIVLMSAHATPDVVRGAIDLGAFRVVTKPFDVREVVALVAEALHQA